MTDTKVHDLNKNEMKPSWSKNAQRVFKSIYRHMTNNQDLYSHPSVVLRAQVHWDTTAWNAAWIAAEAADGNLSG